ncbi:MAG: hypothetical protein K2J16_03860 [Clostridia bacterium]|nr:hypothetical protein [Clostridia bacterium]
MNNTAIQDEDKITFPYRYFYDEPMPFETPCYKVYNDGGHYIATRYIRSSSKPVSRNKEREDIDILFDSLYNKAMQDGVKVDELATYIKDGILLLFPFYIGLDTYIADKIERKRHNLYVRKKRFRRKANLNKWNYFVTFTYDDGKQDEHTFRAKLRKCLSNLHTRRGWRYMGVFERAPETGRLHFHGVFYIPDGEMVGTITEKTDYSTAQGKMQTTYENDFFQKTFGRNDFEELSEMELKHGNTLSYLLKYISKTGERIVYSRGIPTEIYCKLNGNDIITEMQDFGTKYILFDDVISWERDIMRFKYKQLSIIDLICNPPQAA